jgi:hypothetical protein
MASQTMMLLNSIAIKSNIKRNYVNWNKVFAIFLDLRSTTSIQLPSYLTNNFIEAQNLVAALIPFQKECQDS